MIAVTCLPPGDTQKDFKKKVIYAVVALVTCCFGRRFQESSKRLEGRDRPEGVTHRKGLIDL